MLESETGPVPIEARCRVVVTPEVGGLHVQTFTMVRTHRDEWKKIPMADAGVITWDVVEEARVAVAAQILNLPAGQAVPAVLKRVSTGAMLRL